MGQIREVDAISESDLSDAIIATEREIAGEAWGQEDTDLADETGDRSLESMGDGLEGQHEPDDDALEGSEEQDGETDSGKEGEEGEEDQTEQAQAGDRSQEQQRQQAQQDGKVPPSVHRQLREERDAIKTERDGLKVEIEALKAQGGNKAEIDALKTQVATLTQLLQSGRAPARTEPERTAPAEAPDIFENPKGFVDHIQQGFRTELSGVVNTVRENAVNFSLELAHVKHGDAFTNAYAAMSKLNPQNPSDRQTVQSIYNSPNPGEALVNWHRRSETLARVGNDPAAYEERIRTETRDSLLKDPEFIKQVVAAARGDAQRGDNGSPRTQNRLPPSLSRQPGASPRAERIDQSAFDGSEQAVADAAWR